MLFNLAINLKISIIRLFSISLILCKSSQQKTPLSLQWEVALMFHPIGTYLKLNNCIRFSRWKTNTKIKEYVLFLNHTPMAEPKFKVTKESSTGRNLQFARRNWHNVSRAKVVREIESGRHPNMHVRVINWVKTPVTNPDSNTNNNLG